jgi:hypothetical protein
VKQLTKIIAFTICLAFVVTAIGCGSGGKRRVAFGKKGSKYSRADLVVRGQSKKKPSSAYKNMFIWPIDGIYMSGFGVRRGRRHDGIDLAIKGGTPIKASADGEVVFSGRMRGYGNLVLVRHDGNYFTAYAHNRENLADKGDKVKQGEVIAKVGRTGRATGNHVHFEIRKGQLAVNPLHYLPIKKGVKVKKLMAVAQIKAPYKSTPKTVVAKKEKDSEPKFVKAEKKRSIAKEEEISSKESYAASFGNGEYEVVIQGDWDEDEVPPKMLVMTKTGKAMANK